MNTEFAHLSGHVAREDADHAAGSVNDHVPGRASTFGRPRRDRAAQIILGLCAAGALIAAASVAGSVADAEGAMRVSETWQLFGLPVFAGLFVMLARAPRGIAGLWELVIANKLGLAIAGATFLSGTDGGRQFLLVDGTLAALLIAAYTLTRGWTAWRIGAGR